jgi:hypothetical protein
MPDRLMASEYWSTIVAICTIEQYSCSRVPQGTNWNLCSIMGCHGLCTYTTAEEGITAIDSFLAKAERNGRTTSNAMLDNIATPNYSENHICPKWEPTVLKVRRELEAV